MLKTLEDINGEPTKVLLHGPLGDMFGREHSLYISSPAEAVRALCAIKDGFRGELARPGAFYSVLLGDAPLPLEGLGICSAGRDVHIVPVLEGAKSDNAAAGWTLLAGVALLAVTFIATGGAGAFAGAEGFGAGVKAAFAGMTKGYLGQMATTAGLCMVSSGVHTLLSASDSDKPKDERDPSRLFNGAVNTVAQGHPIQICYGEMEIGSALIASMIDYTPVAPGYRDMNTPAGGGDGEDGDGENGDGDDDGPGNGLGDWGPVGPPTTT
jgi:predicted phage tail protein